ncbi:MAG: dihydrolipoamide acetyltransferase family protein [Spirochaetales bacterium]
MAEVLVMPRQGNSVESCLLIAWRVKEGDAVTAKTIVADVETDKASFEVEAGFAGTILKQVRNAGDDVPVMLPIAIIGTPGEDIATLLATSGGSPATGSAAPTAAVSVASPTAPSAPASASSIAAAGASFSSPRARLLAATQGVDATSLTGTGPEGRVIERDVRAVLDAKAPATAAALEAALAAGVALPARGSGLGGRVLAADVGNAPAAVSAAPSSSAAPVRAPGSRTETKIKGIRKVIADRMAESLSTTAQFTLNATALAVRLQELRARLKASDASLGLQGVTIGDLIVFATARTLRRFGYMNAHKVGDTIIEFGDVHIGVACDTPRGLMVPVVRNADSLSLKQISDETKRLAEACRNSTIKPDDLTGSTFSVSNVGAFGIDSFTPVLNVPEVAILGVGGISLKPVQGKAGVEFLPSVGLSLTINHMVVDGAPAAKFLKALSDAIAEVDLVLAQ